VAAYNVKNRVFTGLILHVEVSHQGSRNDWPSYTGFINHRYSRIFCKQMLVGIDIYIYLPSHPPLRQNILIVRPSHILHPSGPQPMLISLGLLINSPFFLPLQLPLSTSGLVLTPFALSLGHPNPIYKIYNPEIKSYPVVNCHITMENHHAIHGKTHINSLFQWPFSIAILTNYHRVYHMNIPLNHYNIPLINPINIPLNVSLPEGTEVFNPW
jgi:hypothetical protein